MIRVVVSYFSLLVTLFFWVHETSATLQCNLPSTKLSDSVTEYEINNARIKVEGEMVKLKLIGALSGEEWTWASIKEGPVRLTGKVELGGKLHDVVQMVALPRHGAIQNWAIFEKANADDRYGVAHFMLNGTLRCSSGTEAEWNAAVKETFGTSFAEDKAIEISDVRETYESLGLL